LTWGCPWVKHGNIYKTIANKWNLGFSQLEHRIYPVIGQNIAVNAIVSSLANQINLVIPAESIRRSRLLGDLYIYIRLKDTKQNKHYLAVKKTE
jgi:hypothetical protein